MSYVTDYASLTAELQAYVDDEVDEFVAELPSIIGRAQERVQFDLGLDMFNETIEDSLPAGESRLPRNSDWLKVHSIFVVPAGRFADRRSTDWCEIYNASASPGHLRYWAEDAEGSLILSPPSRLNDNVRMRVMKRLPVLSSENASNWISSHAGALLLWACLRECEHFLIAPERVAEFENNYTETLARMRGTLSGLQRRDNKGAA